jgi:hypothetical protein
MNAHAAAISRELHTLFARVRVGDPLDLDGLSLVPLFAADSAIDAETLEEGLTHQHTEVSEVSEQGSVNSVVIKHSGRLLLLLIDGEQVVGAKQNRVFNASFLVPPGPSVVVPVSCVEQGRWRYSARGFSASESTLVSSARRAKLGRVTKSVVTTQRYDADQSAVWGDVDRFLESTRVASTTRAFSDGYASRAPEVENRLRKVPVAPGQIGIAAVRGSVLVGLDVFGTAALYAKGWKKVVRGVLADVHDATPAPAGSAEVVRRAITATSSVKTVRQSAPGCGETLHGSSDAFVVGAIVHGGSVYHAFVASAAQAG